MDDDRALDEHNHGSDSQAFDRGAILLSGLCLVHCLALPALIAALPSLAAVLPAQPWVHPAILALAVPLALVALRRGWRRHRRRMPAVLGLTGIALLAAGLAAGDSGTAETALTVAGGLTLAAAHLINWRAAHAGHRHFG